MTGVQTCALPISWHVSKADVRNSVVVPGAARALGCPVAYVNAVGGNDELIFDGRSVVSDARGTITAGLAAFAEELRVVEVPIRPETAAAPAALHATFAQDPLKDMFDALVLGLRDYAGKSGFRRALIALSGGIDSAVVGVVAAAAFGPENVIGVSLPSAISSQHSRDDARVLAANLGIRFETIAIADAVATCESALGPLFAGRPRDVAEENIQARVRGVLAQEQTVFRVNRIGGYAANDIARINVLDRHLLAPLGKVARYLVSQKDADVVIAHIARGVMRRAARRAQEVLPGPFRRHHHGVML